MLYSKTFIAAFLTAGLVHAQSNLALIDIGTPASCGTGTCCTPSCEFSINVLGCTGQVDYIGKCQEAVANGGSDSRDVDGCDGFHGSFLQAGVWRLFNPQGGFWDWAITDCQVPTEGGRQCVPTGGGCTATLTF